MNKYDFIKRVPRVYKQIFGDCTENCLCTAFSILNDDIKFEPSRLFLFYENTYTGNNLKDIVRNIGFCEEKQYPYNKDNIKNKPSDDCYITAKKHRLDGFIEIKNDEKVIDNIKNYLQQNIPVLISLKIRGSGIKNGVLTIENTDPGNGKHCMTLVGWDDDKQEFDILNSWGKKWGNKGFGRITYEYIKRTDLCVYIRCYTKINKESI